MIRGGAKAPDELVTVVVTHRVGPEHVQEFLAWQERLRLAESRFRRFSWFGAVPPHRRRPGRVDRDVPLRHRRRSGCMADLRRAARTAGRRQEVRGFRVRARSTTRSAAGSRSTTAAADAQPPSDIKTSIAVWVGLYPTVVLLTLALSPLKMPLWLGMLVGNLLSSFAMSFVTMPFYVNPLLKKWLRLPDGVPKTRANLRGIVHHRRGDGGLDGGFLSRYQGVLAPALTSIGRPGGQARSHRRWPAVWLTRSASTCCLRIRAGEPELATSAPCGPAPLTRRSAPDVVLVVATVTPGAPPVNGLNEAV